MCIIDVYFRFSCCCGSFRSRTILAGGHDGPALSTRHQNIIPLGTKNDSEMMTQRPNGVTLSSLYLFLPQSEKKDKADWHGDRASDAHNWIHGFLSSCHKVRAFHFLRSLREKHKEWEDIILSPRPEACEGAKKRVFLCAPLSPREELA